MLMACTNRMSVLMVSAAYGMPDADLNSNLQWHSHEVYN